MVTRAAEVLRSGGVILYPTETVYGLGGDATKEEPVRKIFQIKNRDGNKPLIILVKDLEMARDFVDLGPHELALRNYWPGPLSGVFRSKASFPEEVASPEGAVALRISSHPFVIELFKLISFPLVSTSANRSGDQNSLSVEEVRNSLRDAFTLIDFVADGGELPSSPPSTLIDFTKNPPIVLRSGSVLFNSP